VYGLAVHDWEHIRRQLEDVRDGSRNARKALAELFGDDYGSDIIQWHAAARSLLRKDVEAELADLGALDASARDYLESESRALYSLNLATELEAIARRHASSRAITRRVKELRAPRTLAEIVADRVWIAESGHVRSTPDYVSIAYDLLDLADVDPASVDCDDHGATRELVVELGRRHFRATLSADAGIDVGPLLACLNEVLVAANKRARFCEVREPGWGDRRGIALASQSQLKLLRAAKLTVT
jgi:hypothetical protein